MIERCRMSRPRIQIAPHLSRAELTQRYETCQNAKIKSYWQAIQLLSQQNPCLSVEQVANTVGFSTDWVRKLAHRYNRLGANGIAAQPRSLRKESLKKESLRQEMQSANQ